MLSSTPFANNGKKGLEISGNSKPISFELFLYRERATSFGEKSSSFIAASIFSRASLLTYPLSLIALDTVATETPASFATSRIVAMISLLCGTDYTYIITPH